MVNVQKLRGKMVEQSITAEMLAKALGINKASLYRRFAEPGKITVNEVYRIKEELSLTTQEVESIFFA